MPAQGRGQNRLLGCLSEAEYQPLARHSERVKLSTDTLLAEPGTQLEYAYFPVGCVLSSIVVLSNNSSVEAATAGNEGMVHVGLALDQRNSPYRIVPQISGECLRIPVNAFHDALQDIPRLRDVLQRYCLTLLLQSSQNAACNLRHNTEERTARWLLVCADRANRTELDLTQEFLGELLGVRRQSVNVSVGALQRAGLIAYRRGGMTIVDRAGLEAAACECYRVNIDLYNSVMEMECADGVRVV
jgi:CRP-like cAMP-binding protein